ncbi:hypothetical protein PMI21_02690, partial [Pseudomonas sp. GM18]
MAAVSVTYAAIVVAFDAMISNGFAGMIATQACATADVVAAQTGTTADVGATQACATADMVAA